MQMNWKVNTGSHDTCRNVVSNEFLENSKVVSAYYNRCLELFPKVGHAETRENVQWLEPSDAQTMRLHQFTERMAQCATF